MHCPSDALPPCPAEEWASSLFHYTATLPLAFFLTPYLRDLLHRGGWKVRARTHVLLLAPLHRG